MAGFTSDRDGYPIFATWTICPDCGVGKGADHKNGCPREQRRRAAFSLDPSIDYGAVVDPRMKLTIKDMPTFPCLKTEADA